MSSFDTILNTLETDDFTNIEPRDVLTGLLIRNDFPIFEQQFNKLVTAEILTELFTQTITRQNLNHRICRLVISRYLEEATDATIFACISILAGTFHQLELILTIGRDRISWPRIEKTLRIAESRKDTTTIKNIIAKCRK